MSIPVLDIPVPLSVSAGGFVNCADLADKWIGVSGTFTATIQFQWSPDGTAATAVNEGAAVTAAGVVQIRPNGGWVRANVTAYSTGTPVAKMSGRTA